MNHSARINYNERINQVKQYIREHVDEPLNRAELAQIAGFSVSHFHRIFTAHVGENITVYVRRVRMARAARQLLADVVSIMDIALASGYETHSAFSKAFKDHFGVSPTAFRKLDPMVATHLISKHLISRHSLYNRKEKIMQLQEIRTLPDTRVLYARASEVLTGPAFQTAHHESIKKLMSFLGKHNLPAHVQQIITIYPDEPEIGKEVRIDAGAIFAAGEEPTAADGLSYQTLPGGRWAIFRHVGPFDTIGQTWQGIYRDWLPASGEELRDALPFEDYVDDPNKVAPEELRTDLYLPLQ